MRTLTVKSLQDIENQSFIAKMYRTWVLILSIGIMLPLRWLPNAMPRPSKMAFPVVATMALVTCGELVLANPTITPAGPYCPGAAVQISFTGTNLPDGGTLQVFWGNNSGYDPCSGGGTQIGTVPIDYPCTTCPSLLGLMINACNTEQENEFMLFHSGCGFNVSDLSIDLLPAGSSPNDIGTVTCPFMTPSASLMAGLQANTNCSNLNVIAAGPGTQIPAAALVISFMNNTDPTVNYDISYLCGLGLPVYVVQNSCALSTGAFANTCTAPRVYSISTPGCTSSITYGSPDCTAAGIPNPGLTGHVFMYANGTSWDYSATDCNHPNFAPINFPDVSPSTMSLNYTIPAGICGASTGMMTYYGAGMIDMSGFCPDLCTPPTALPLSIACPAIIDPAGPFCSSNGLVQLTVSGGMGAGTWSGGAYISSTGVFNPALAAIGNNMVSYTDACGTINATIMVSSPPVMQDGPSYFILSATSCVGDSSGQIVYTGTVSGGPYTLDWDAVITGGNDVYADDGQVSLNGVPSGFYHLIATNNATGCKDTATVFVEPGSPVSITTQVVNNDCFGQTIGSIQITSIDPNPPGFYIFDWDNAATGGNDNYGGPAAVDDDDEDIYNLAAGTYYLTVTVTDMFSYSCTLLDTFVVTQPPQLSVTGANVALACFGNTTVLTASPSGGTPGYIYYWSHLTPNPPADPASVTVGAGNYVVTVTDNEGCTSTAVFMVTQPASALTVTAMGSTVACNNNMGTVTSSPMGGTAPYTYVWSNGPTTQNQSGLNSGTYMVTVTDFNGCTAIATAIVTLTPPTFVDPPDAGSTVPCPTGLTTPTPPVVLDNCLNPVPFTGPVIAGAPTCEGIVTYTWTYTLGAVSHTYVYTYTIEYLPFPAIPPTSATASCVGTIVVPSPPPITDNCGVPLTPTGPTVSSAPACEGPITYTWVYTDCEGNTQNYVHTVTIERNAFPPITPTSATVACVSAIVVPAPPLVNDDCGNAIIPTGPTVSSPPACEGAITYTWVYTDCEGNTQNYVHTVTIERNPFPPIAPTSATVACASAIVVPTPPVVNDNCGNAITPTGPTVSSPPTCEGTITYTWVYTDCEGNTQNYVHTVTIEYNPFPPITPTSATVACVSAIVVPTPPVVNDNCGNAITPTGPVVSPPPACEGTITYTWTYTDCEGNAQNYVHTVTIEINPFPPIAPTSGTVACAAAASAPAPPVINDNCGNVITPTGPVISSPPPCEGPVTFTWTYTDCEGNAQNYVHTATIEYLPFPAIPPTSATAACVSAIVVPAPPVVNDNCGNTLTPTGPVVSPPPACEGTVTYTWTYTDCEGNTQNYIHTVTIEYGPFPAIAPTNATAACVASIVVPTPPVVNDNCGNAITPTGPVVSPPPACEGTVTYTWTYTDCEGNTQNYIHTVTISAPIVSLPAGGSSTVACPSDAVAPTPPTVMDNCNRPITPSAGVPSADPACAGIKTWTFTYTACNGTPYNWVYTYTISAPTVTLPAGGSSTVPCTVDAVAPTPPTVLDNCLRPITPSAGVPSADPPCAGGTKTWTFTYTACNGVPNNWVYTYTVLASSFTLPANGASTVACVALAVVPTPPTVIDACGNTITPSAGVPSADPPCAGTKTWTFTYIGCDGIPIDWVYTYTISAPTVTMPAGGSSTVACAANAASPVPPTVLDNCGRTLTVSAGVPSADPPCAGTKTWTFTYTACDGTTYPWVYTYTISAPVVTIPAGGSLTVACPTAATAPTPPTVMDNCGRTLTVSAGVPSADPPCAGTKTWTFTYTACDGTTYPWVYTYTISAPTVTLPAAGSSTVACPTAATAPTPPAVSDNCGRVITPSAGVPSADPPCAGPKTWTFTYTACDGTPYNWVYTYTISPPTVTLPAGGSSTVPCTVDAVAPTPPTVMDNCLRPITPSAGVPSADPPCAGGTKTWTFTYTACNGTPYNWVYTYTVLASSFTLPANGASTVACPALAVLPTPPTVIDACGNTVPPSAGVPSADPPCAGTKTWTFTYIGCDGIPVNWIYTYTISAPTVTMPAGGSSTVACAANATVPVPPTVLDNCGRTLTVSAGVPTADPPCAGTKTWTFTYTACDGTTYPWVYTYTISAPVVTIPAGGSLTVACPAAATAPTPPTVMDNCGRTLTVSAGVPSADPPCAGTKTWTFTYTACDGTTYPWVYTYTISAPTVTLPAGGSSTVACPTDAVAPTPPAVMDNCNRVITPSAGVPSADPPCAGPKTWTFTYTACDGTPYNWVYTYTISPPTVTLPAGGSSTVPCTVDAVAPTPPTVMDNCNRPITPSAGVPSADPPCAGGTKTWTFTYTACNGTPYNWVYTYTVLASSFTLPANGSSTVACPALAIVPTPPTVIDACGNTITPSAGVPSADPPCAGTKTWTFTYIGCDGIPIDWVYTYTISAPTVTMPADGSSTVACAANATVPVPPTVLDNCGRTLTVSAGVPTADPPCAGTKTWTFTYTACDGTTFPWVYTYTISAPVVTMPAGGSLTVACPAAATAPTPPTVMDNCGRTLTVSAGVPSADPPCAGTKTWTFTYTACDGTTYPWVYTYTISAPTVTLPAAGSSTVACPTDAVAPSPPAVMDNCNRVITPSAGVPSADPPCAGSKTWTFTYTACDGTPYNWVYTYTISPPIVTLPAGGSSTVACASDAIAPVPPSVMDNCNRVITPTAGVPSADPPCSGGTKTWTFTYTACDGTPFNWVYTYTILPSSFTLPAPGSSTVACPALAIAPTPTPVIDDCGNTITPSAGVPSADPPCAGTKTWTFTYTGCDGIPIDWVYTYTISAPIVTIPAGGSSTVDCAANATTPVPPTVMDNCGRTLTVSAGVPSADPPCAGTKTWTFTYTACDGTTYPWVYTYTINAPIVTIPAGGSLTVACPVAATAPTPPTVMDNCGRTLTVSAGVPSADPPCAGTKTWTFTYTACDGTTYPWVYTYTISAPTVTLPAAGSATVACPADAVAPAPPAVMDNCNRVITPSAGVPSADPPCAGTKTWTFTYTACDGTPYNWVYTYTISAPTVTLPAGGSSTVACATDAVAPTPPTVMDNCGRSITPSAGVPSADPPCSGGTKTWTFTYTACDGTPYNWVYTYTVLPSSFALPAPGSSTVACPALATAPTPAPVIDDCGNTITPSAGVPSADPPCAGIKTWTFTYTGCDGIPVDWVYTYTISPPMVTMPVGGSSTVACIADATVPVPPSVMDNCNRTLTVSAGVPGADPVCSGTKTWTFTYTDCDGSTYPWVYTYTISPPTFTIPAAGGTTVACVSDAQVVPTPPVVNNSCGTPLTMTGPVVSADPVCSGTKTYTWTYTDCTGTSGQWVYTYTITPPTSSLPAGGSLTVACVSDAQVVPTPPSVNNSCGDPLTVTGPVIGADPVCSGTKTYTWTFTDCTGTSTPWVYTYTITPPTFTLPAAGSSTVPCLSDAQVVPTPPVVNNSCGVPLTVTGPVVGADPVCSGNKTYTWTYTDCTGTTGQWVYTYTINASTFTLPAPGGSNVPCISDAQVVPTPPVVNNSCGDPVTPTGPVVGADPACSGPKTYTWTYTDCSGTNTPWVYTYTIAPPTFVLPADGSSTVACVSDAQLVPTPPVVNNSCGSPLTLTGPVVGPDPVCAGTKTYTWTYTDCTGTSDQWVYTYTINPSTFTLPADGGSTVACISDAQVVPTPPTANNSCGDPLTLTGPVISPDPACSGIKTYTWTYTDCSGTTGQWVYTYTITPPTFTLPAAGGSTVACISDAQVVPIPPVVNNSCGTPLTTTGPVISADPVCSGTKTYTWTYTDCTGTTAQWVFTYTVTPPTSSLPSNGSATVACISGAQVIPTPPVVNNSCGDPLTVTGPVVGADPVCSGTKTYTWTFTDCTGTSTPWVYTYTITPPTFTLPAAGSSTVPCIGDAQIVPTPPVVNNSCGDPLAVSGPVVGADPLCSGNKTYTWTYTDCTGTTGQWVYTYTINAPTFTVPSNDGSNVACISDAQVVPTPPVVTNSCGDPVTPTGPVVGPDPVCSGPKTYTWTYTDCSGTNTPWVYTYTIAPPTFILPADDGSTVSCVGDAQVVPTPPSVDNSCGDPLTLAGPVVGPDPVCSGTKTYTWTYTDCTGTSGQWVYTYTINPSTFTLPADDGSTVACISDAQVVPTPPPANNSCGDPLTLTGPVVGPNPVCSGTKTYTWTYTDCSGTSGQWVYTYTITPPTFTLPADDGSTVACVSDAQVVPTPPVVNNSCGAPLTMTGPVVSADPVCSGTKTYTWTYTDCTGTTGQWVYTYTILPSTFTLPVDDGSTVGCILDAQIQPTPPPANNACGDPLTLTGPVISADPVCSGTKTYTWTYTDCSGTSAQWVYTYTITPPTFTIPAAGSSTVPCLSDAQVVPTPPAVNNSCGAPLTISGPVVGADPVCSGTKTYTWTYTDCTGTTGQWVYTYTISAPTFTVPANGGSNVACISDAQVVPTPPIVTNSCGDPVTPTGPVVGADPVCSGPKTYTWTFTDCSGTNTPWVYTYTIAPPTFTLPANGSSTVACISDAQVVPIPPSVDNSCGVPLTLTGPVVGADPICTGTKTYTWTYTDCTGTSGQWVYTYTILPSTFTLPAPGASTVGCIVDAQIQPTPPPANNACGDPLTLTGPVISPDPVCSGTKTYTWTYTDCSGTSDQWVYTYTITPPTFTLPADDGSTVACVSDAQVVPTPPVVTNSCGAPLTITGPVVGTDPVCSGTKTYTWTYTDCTGTTGQWVYTYTITPPSVVLPSDVGSTVACIVDAQVIPTPPSVTNSCGDPLSLTGPVISADPVCSGTKTYTWTFTDCTGATGPWVYTYTITPPAFTLPADDGSTVACIADAQVVPVPPAVNNSCGDPLAISGPVVGADPVCSGTKTYTWTYTDCNGTTGQWVYTYTISATTFTLPAPGASNVPCISDAQVVPTPPVVNNSCGDPVIPTGPVVGPDPVCAGPKTYTWTFTDCDGTMTDWVYTYNIAAPTIVLPPDDGSTVSCIGDAQVVPTPPVVNNSCGDPVIPTGPVVGADPVCSGPKTYTWTYTDCNGGSGIWVYTYNVLPAAFSLPADDGSTVACIVDAQVAPTPPSANNSCGDPLTLTGPVISPDPVCSGTKTYVWTYTDCAGNTSDWTYTYTITPPTFTLPADDGSTVGCLLDAQIQPTPPAATNSCGDALTLTGPVIGADPVCSGTKTYTWTYTDCTGTSGPWVYTYTITPPTLAMPADGGSTVACVSDAQVVPVPPVVNNSCGDPAAATGPVVSADPVCSGTKTYTWTYTDCTGANVPWVYTYTVTPPTLSLPADDGSTVSCVSDAQVIPSNPAVNNSCGDPLTITGPVVGADPVCAGTKTYTWTYTDCSGASADWTYTYTVMPSIFNLPADDGSTVPCSSDAQSVPIPPVVTNACGDPIAATGPVISADPACSGTKTYIWTYTDCGGASLDWTYTYTITGDSGPVFVAPPGDVSVPCVADVPVMIDLSYTNDCSGGGTVTGSDSAINGACPATITRTWTITDACGNVATETQTITINDVTPPTASDPSPITVAGCNTAVPVPDISVVLDAADNCGVPTVAFVSDASSLVGCIETTTRTFSITDDCNNSITVTQIITRTVDTTPPVLTAPADVTFACIAQVPPIPDLTYTDNCSPGGTIAGTETPPSGNPLTIIRTWTVMDDCGNAATVTQTITITQTNPVTDLVDSFCEGSTYTLPDGSTTTNGGLYGPYTFTGQGGCDSIVNLDLTELIPDTTYLVDNFCENTTYTLPDGSLTTNGGMFGPYPFTGANTCDSIVYLDLTEVPEITNDIVDDFCEGTDYTLPDGSTTSSAGTYGPYTFPGSNGCDSIVNLTLDMIDTSEIHLVDEICLGDPYMLPDGSTPGASGMYGPYVFAGAAGCDSTIYVDLTIFSGGTGNEDYVGCTMDGYSVVVNGNVYDEATPDGIETIDGPGGCDSVVTIHLVFHPTSTGIEDYNGCSGDGYSVVVGGTIFDESNPIGTVTLVNSFGCDSTVMVDLNFANFEQAIIDVVGPVCTTAGVQTLTASPPGGIWSGDINSDQFDPALLGVGTHQVIYTVNPGACQSADTIDINVYELIISCQATQDESAPGANDGEGQVTVSGGVAPYNVTWTGPVSGSIVLNADGSFVITSLAAGPYTIEVEDASGVTCTATCQFTVGSNVPCDLTLNPLVIQDATCPGIDNGVISASATGSMPPFEYSLDGITYQSSPVFTGLAPGPYTVYVRDVALCVDTEDGIVGVGQGPVLDIVEVIDASCGVANGSIEVFAVNGTSPYTYSIDCITFGLSGLFPGLSAGTYVICVLDAAGCTDNIPVTISAANAPVIDNVITVDASCGNADGSLTILASGGVPPFMYSNDGGATFQSSPTFINLLAGSYPLVVQDATGCETPGTATIQNAGGPVIDAIATVPTSCGQSDGSITVTATGVPVLMYSLNGTTYQTSNIFLGRPSGNYTVYVRDGNGCVTTQMVTIATTDGPQLISIVETDTKCGEDDGTILITATGGTGDLDYILNGDSYGDQNFIENLEAGTYVVVVEDENGCTASGQVTINDSELPDFDDYPDPAHCGRADGQIEVEGFDGVPGYMFSFNGGAFSSTTIWTNLVSDFYTITVRDAAGCTAERDVFVGDRPAPVISSVQISLPGCGLFDGAIEVTTAAPYPGQILMYSIQLPFYQSSPIFNPVAPGTYTINVMDQFGCLATPVPITINPNPVPTIAGIIVEDTDCGMSTGKITVTATGGITPYTYSIDGVSFISMNMFTGLGAGTYTVTVRGANGCEVSQDATIISVGSQESDLADVFCAGSIYVIHDSTFTSPGMYDVLVPGGAANGCDSTIHLDLSELPLVQDTIDEEICVGDIYTINGMDYTAAGIYLIDTVPAATGCDTILYLNLTVNPLDTTYLNETICTGGVYSIGGIDYTMAGTYLIDTIPAAVGCDSIRFLVLAVADYNTDTIVSILCEGEVYTYNGIDYSTTGIFTLDTLAGPGGCDTILALDLTMIPLPTANAGADQILDCATQVVTLNGSATGDAILWIGPGINASNDTQLMPAVTQSGVYYLTSSTPPNCSAVDSVVVTLDPSTVVSDAGADAFISCDIDTIILQAGPLGTDLIYQWTGPGINASNEHSINPVITLPGIYTLVVTDTATQCVSLPDTVFIDDIRVVIIAIIQDPVDSINCYITEVDLEATGSSVGPNIVYTWFDSDGNLVSSSPGFPVSSGGMWTLVVEDTISGCFDNDSIFVEDLTEYPPADAGSPQVIDCNNPTVILNEGAVSTFPDVVFHWIGPAGGIIGSDSLLSVLVGIPGYYYHLMAIDTATGCQNMDSVFVTDLTAPPLADANLVENITCIDTIALLNIGTSDAGIDIDHSWFGPGTNNVLADSIEPSLPGLFILTVTNQLTGCFAKDSVSLALPQVPTDMLADIDIPFCEGDDSGTLTINNVTGGIPVYMYSINGDTLQSSPVFEDLMAGVYTIAVVDGNGCTYAESFTVADGQALTIDIGPDIFLELGDSVILWADVSLPWSMIDSIVWDPLEILSCEYCTNPVLYALHDDIISATVYSGGCIDQDILALTVDVDADIYIPNVFSPNDDGINDHVTVFTDHRVKRVVYLEIFDRWGNQVFVGEDFEPNDPLKGWDGSFRGKKMNPAVFAYIARVELINGEEVSRKGDITLLR